MIKDRRPYYIKKLTLLIRDRYAEHFLKPHFRSFGKGGSYMTPWNVKVFGGPIDLGDYANIIATSDRKVRLTVWGRMGEGSISIGDCALICPGVRIGSATGITIGHSCMMANGVYITDADWHGIYDRIDYIGGNAPVAIGNNVWLGDSVIVCKGVTIGDNSIVGAGSVVTKSLPSNIIAVGNPAVPIRDLDPTQPMRTRAEWFSDFVKLDRQMDDLDRRMLRGNTLLGWLKSLVFPPKEM